MAAESDTPERGSRSEKHGRRGRRTRRREPVSTSRRVQRIQEDLPAAAREIYQQLFGARFDKAKPFTLRLALRIEPGQVWRLETQPPLEEQLRTAVRDMAVQTEACQPGRVYCYRCDSALCAHAVPPGPTKVFGGYSSTGLPLWHDLPQVLLELKHPEVDLLFQPAGARLLAACMDSEMLRQRQLDIFGRRSKTYDVLGQVVFGFLAIRSPASPAGEKERVAFSLQAVEFRRRDGRARLELNILGRLADGSDALDLLDGPQQLRVYDILAAARQRIRSLAPASAEPCDDAPSRPAPEKNGAVMDTLRRLAGNLEKAGRQQARRTTHAETRRATHRPTSNAREDALAASDDQLYWDEHCRTLVVIGPRNRTHVFSPQGRHITSLVMEGEAVKSRLRRGRWTRPTRESLLRFRSALAAPSESSGSA